MVKKSRERKEKPLRTRQLRDDASIKSVKRTIEKKLGLPEGTISLVSPGGRKVRSDAKVRTLRKKFGDSD